MSIALLCGVLYGVMRAAMLCCVPVNRVANSLLAALIAVLALYTAPYIIGYAGYYDVYPWLSFAPYNLTLAAGPLLYLYVTSVCGGGAKMPRRWPLDLLPVLLQLLYYCWVFAQPLAFKNTWDAEVHRPYVDPLETAVLMASLVAYALLAWRRYRQAGDARPEWLRNLLVAMGLTVSFWLILVGAEFAASGLSYFQRFPFYLWLAILVCYLGAEGGRHGAVPFPVSTPAPAAVVPDTETIEPLAAAPNLAELGEQWRATIIAEQWWRDPDLSMATLARRLGTNTTLLSRALNEGLGLNFNEVINRLRVNAVVAALGRQDDRPVLDIALAEGFNSKASFNRAFKLYTGETPTEYRRRVHLPTPVSTSS